PRPQEACRYLIPLPELLSELTGTGAGSRAVEALQGRIVKAFGSEYQFLFDAPVEEIERSVGPLAAEAVRRMREGQVDPKPGYDGEFGVIRVFNDAELERLRGQDELFPSAGVRGRRTKRAALEKAGRAPPRSIQPEGASGSGTDLDDRQRAVVESEALRIVVSAGPGTGKTRLLTNWLARQIKAGTAPDHALALTFTRRAAEEMRERLAALLGERAAGITAATFHAFAFGILRARFPGIVTVYNPSQRPLLLSLMSGADLQSSRETADHLERIYEGMEEPDEETRQTLASYETFLESMGGVDLSSLVQRALDLLKKEPQILDGLRKKLTVIAVDELQDINRPQYELLSLLCRSAARVLSIGDPDQAIYGFRGSDRGLFFRFREETAASPFGLARNYRSAGPIVRAADSLISSARSPGNPRLSADRETGPAIGVFHAADPDEEGSWIAEQVRDLVGGVDSVSVEAARARADGDAHARGPGAYSFADMAILFRTRAVRDALLPGLARAGLPFTFRDNTPLAQEEPFRFLIAGLRLIANPADRISLRELEGHAGLSSFLARRDELQALVAAQGVEAAVDELSRSLVSLDRSVPETALGEEVIRESAREHGADLAGFLTRIGLLARESEGGRVIEKVSLLTFHAAKGLEYPVVFVAGAEDGIVPRGDDPAEERRLFFVAVTRAREALFITHCARRFTRGVVTEARPTPYLSDIPADCMQAVTRARTRRGDQLNLFG
ncbi:MAG TPA: UvrD-helicase domain-containing protein, partial [Spirochaetia bacterium]|nr:UvrD-helicase domain-containing protein [Spirochaetia bacterium]